MTKAHGSHVEGRDGKAREAEPLYRLFAGPCRRFTRQRMAIGDAHYNR